MQGWIKLHRKLKTWRWYKDSIMVHLFIHLLFSANRENGFFMDIPVKRGQLITGLYSLNEATGISIRSLRTALKRLENTNEIIRKTTNKYSLITLLNYETYQDKDKQSDKRTTIKRQSNDNKQEGKEGKEVSLHTQIVDGFFKGYKNKFGFDYQATPADFKQLKDFLKLNKDMTKELFLQKCAEMLDNGSDYVKENFSLKVVCTSWNTYKGFKK